MTKQRSKQSSLKQESPSCNPDHKAIRKRAEEALRESEKKYRRIVDTSIEGIWVLGPDTRTTSVNARMAELLGCSSEEMNGRPVTDFLFEEDVADHREKMENRRRGLSENYECRFRRKDGQPVWTLASATPIFDEEDHFDGSFAMFTDITDRKRSEQALEEERRMFIGGPSVVFRWRAAEGWPVEYVSPNVAAQFGYTAEDFISGRILYASIVHPDDINRVADEVQSYSRAGVPCFEQDYRIRTADGRERWLYDFTTVIRDAANIITHYLGYVQDITERKHAEEALNKVHEELKRTLRFDQALLSAIPTPVFFKNTDGLYLGCNRAFSEFMGVSSDRLKGKTAYELWPSEHAKVYQSKDLELLRNPVRQVYEFKVRDRHGVERPVIYSKDVFRDENDRVAGIVGAFMDITERKRAETELARVNRALRMLSDSNQALIRIADETTLLNEVCRIAVEVGGYRMAWVGFAERDAAQTLRPMAHTGINSDKITSVKASWGDNEHGRCPGGIAIRSKRPCVVHNIATETTFDPWREAAVQCGHTSAIALPLISEESTFGMLGIYSSEPDAFDAKEVEILRELAGDLSFGITALRTKATGDKAEEALQKSETLYRTIINSIQDVFYRTDEQSRIRMASPSILPLLGFDTLDELVGQPITMLWKQPEKRQAMLDRLQCDGFVNDYEVELQKKDGTPVFVSVSTSLIAGEEGGFAGTQGIFRDNTKRKQAEDNLRESEERYRLIAENTADTITVLDLNLHTTYVSPAVQKLRGYSVQEAMTQSLDQILTPASLQQAQAAFAEQMALEANGHVDLSRTALLELEEYCKDGSTKWVELAASFLRDNDSKPVGILTVARDITDRRRAEKIQTAIYRISESAQTAPGLDILFHSIHTVIAELMPARNFYIALYHAAAETVLFPYFADEFDTPPPPRKISKGLTDYVLLTGKSLLATPEVFEQLARSGQIESIGSPSVDWLGVPLKTRLGETIGVMAVQTYTEDVRLDSTCRNILEFVSTQVAMAVERKRAEEALQRSEEKYRTLVENLSDVIFTLDVQGRFTYISPAIEQYTGYRADQVIGHPFSRYIHPDDLSGLVSSFGRSLAGQREPYEFRVYHKDGTVRYMRTSSLTLMEEGIVTGLTGVMSDITELKQAEVDLRRLTHAIEQSPVSVIMTNKAGDIEYVNPKFTQITGYTKEEVLGRKPRILKSGETPPAEYQNLWETILDGREWRGEFHNKRKNGELFWESASISPVRNDTGDITHFIAIKEDITARKLAEEELHQNEMKRHELQRELIQAQKLESLGTLASGIAHDFNNILSIILGHCALLEHGQTDSSLISQSLPTIQKATLRGAALVKQLLTFARKSESVFVSISINHIINEIINLLRETLPKTINASADLDPDIPSILADATQIHQVLLNLCVNARDAMPKGGNLTIAATTVENEEVVTRFPRASARGYVLVSVTDTGTGMDDETKQRMFDPFFTTKGAGKGTGLGLALVYSIVESHKGMIGVESAPGKGTTFNLYFPIEERPIENLESPANPSAQIPGGTETVLLIEDEEMLADLVKSVLVANGYTVLTARDGAEGLEMFAHYREQIAVVLSDFGLPKYGGDEVFKRIKAIDAKARVILASGFIEPSAKSDMLAAGLQQFIQKPYSPTDVLRAIRTALDARES